MTAELLPCPFCGAAAHMANHYAGEDWTPMCLACGTCCATKNTEEAAVASWNARASLPSQPPAPGEVEQAKDAEIEAAYEALQQRRKEAGAALFRSRIGLPCGRCGENVYASDSNGYNTFHRCLGCAHVPFWKDDGTELLP